MLVSMREEKQERGAARGKGFENQQQYICYANAVLYMLAGLADFKKALQKRVTDKKANKIEQALCDVFNAIAKMEDSAKEEVDMARVLANVARNAVIEMIQQKSEMNKKRFGVGKHAAAGDWLEEVLEGLSEELQGMFTMERRQADACRECLLIQNRRKVKMTSLQVSSQVQQSLGEAIQRAGLSITSTSNSILCGKCGPRKRVLYETVHTDAKYLIVETNTPDQINLPREIKLLTGPAESPTETFMKWKEAILHQASKSGTSGHFITLSYFNEQADVRNDDDGRNGTASAEYLGSLKADGYRAVVVAYERMQKDEVRESTTETVDATDKTQQGSLPRVAIETHEKLTAEADRAVGRKLWRTDWSKMDMSSKEKILEAWRVFSLTLHFKSAAKMFQLPERSSLLMHDDAAVVDKTRLMTHFPDLCDARVSYDGEKQILVLDFETVQDLHKAYRTCFEKVLNKQWDPDIQYSYLKASYRNGGLKNDEYEGRVVIEPVIATSEEDATVQVYTALNKLFAYEKQRYNVQLDALLEMPISAKPHGKKPNGYIVFVVARLKELAAKIIEDFERCSGWQYSVKLCGNDELALCYQCNRRGHKAEQCEQYVIRIDTQDMALTQKAREYLKHETGAQRVIAGNGPEAGRVKNWGTLFFNSMAQQQAAVPKVQRLVQLGVLEEKFLCAKKPPKCCDICGKYTLKGDSTVPAHERKDCPKRHSQTKEIYRALQGKAGWADSQQAPVISLKQIQQEQGGGHAPEQKHTPKHNAPFKHKQLTAKTPPYATRGGSSGGHDRRRTWNARKGADDSSGGSSSEGEDGKKGRKNGRKKKKSDVQKSPETQIEFDAGKGDAALVAEQKRGSEDMKTRPDAHHSGEERAEQDESTNKPIMRTQSGMTDEVAVAEKTRTPLQWENLLPSEPTEPPAVAVLAPANLKH